MSYSIAEVYPNDSRKTAQRVAKAARRADHTELVIEHCTDVVEVLVALDAFLFEQLIDLRECAGIIEVDFGDTVTH